MIIEFPIEDSVRMRSSVRSYADRQIEPEKIVAIKQFAKALDNPFGKKVVFRFFDANALTNQQAGSADGHEGIDSCGQQEGARDARQHAPSTKPQKIGTYGVIKGASQFVGASIKREPMALEALGYEMEVLVLYLTSLDLGSCWLGGTFDREGFAEAMDVGEDWLLPAITPYGYGAQKMHLKENLMRRLVGAEKRKPWEQLFFYNNFDTPLTKQLAEDLAIPLEMVRLGPSASNKQPWRVLVKDEVLHFFEDKSPGYSAVFSYDIQRIDMGIAAAHFELSAREKGIAGRLEADVEVGLELPNSYEYVFSWCRE